MKSQINKKSAGYTLIEILIAVTIFTGIIILALAVFSQTINANNRNDAVRQRTEAARSAIDQITTDFQYLADDSSLTTTPAGCSGAQFSGKSWCVLESPINVNSDSQLLMVLKYPNSQYVEKQYQVVSEGTNSYDLQVKITSCTLSGQTINCPSSLSASFSNLISSDINGYVLASDNIFSASQAATSTSEGYVGVDLKVKAANSSSTCLDTSDDSDCYELSTVLNPGGLR